MITTNQIMQTVKWELDLNVEGSKMYNNNSSSNNNMSSNNNNNNNSDIQTKRWGLRYRCKISGKSLSPPPPPH